MFQLVSLPASHLQLEFPLPPGPGGLGGHLLVEGDAALGVALVNVVILQVLLHLLNKELDTQQK